MALPEPAFSERKVRFLFHYLDYVKILFERLAVLVRNRVTAFSKLNPALAVMAIYAFCMGTGFIMWIGMAFLDLAAGTHVLETVNIHVMEGFYEHVLPAFQFLNGLLGSLVGFSILLDCLNIDVTLYVNSNRSRIIPNKKSTLSLRFKMIRALPKGKYGRLRREVAGDVRTNNSSPSSSSCAICLGIIGEDEGVRILPNCRHYFHISCIDRWLLLCSTNNSSCPLCRAIIVSSGLPPKHISTLQVQVAN